MIKVVKKQEEEERGLKNYKINLKADGHTLSKNRQLNTLFPSYPSAITSQDDFYVNNQRLVITETTLQILNEDSYEKNFKKDEYFPTFLKVAAANLNSKTPDEWIQTFKFQNTNTYNSHWMLLDMKNVQNSVGQKEIPEKTFYYVEQVPDSIKSEDVSSHMNEKSYWASYNIPYVKEHQDLAGYTSMLKIRKSSDFSFDKNIRAQLFNQLQAKVSSVQDMEYVIRFNNPKDSDAEKYGQLQVDDTSDTIASRYDLKTNSLFGETDGKVTSLDTVKNQCFFAVMSPTTEGQNLKPFSIPNDVYSHLQGVPQTYNYNWEKICG